MSTERRELRRSRDRRTTVAASLCHPVMRARRSLFFLCAACDCHRSFHRNKMDGMFVVKFNSFGPSQRPLVSRHVSPIMMSFGGGGGGRDPAESSTEDLNKFHHLSFSGNGADQFHQYHPKKRFRTKFNQEQKEKMMEFAEKIGWKMSKQEDEEVDLQTSPV